MFNVHDWAYSILLYTVSVGFGIAYSVSRAMREPYTRDKQSGRFPRSFLYATSNTIITPTSRESRWEEVAPDTDIG